MLYTYLKHTMFNLHQLHMFDKSIGLKTSTCQCLVIDIAPPGGYRKLLVLHQLKHALSICTKLHTFGKIPGLKTSKGQYSDVIIAPPVDNRMCQSLH